MKNESGFTLMEVMISAGILGIVALVMMQVMKSQMQNEVDSKITSSLTIIKTDIQSILTNPKNCNANFVGLGAVTNSAVTSIKICNGTSTQNCRNLGGTAAAKYPVVSSASSWSTNEKVRVIDAKVTVIPLNPSPMTAILTTASVVVTFQMKPLKTGGKTQETVTFTTPVIYNGTSVIGCPIVWNSTVPY